MTLLHFGKHRNELLETTPESYIRWIATHKMVLSPEHRPISDIAKAILERREQAAKLAEAVSKFEAEREARMAVKAAEQIVRANQGTNNNSLNVSRGFCLMR